MGGGGMGGEEPGPTSGSTIGAGAGAGTGWKVICNPTPGLRLMLVVVWGVAFSQQVSGVEAVMYYQPLMFEKAGLCRRRDNLAITLVVGIIKTAVVLLAARFLDSLGGRRRLLLISLAGVTVSLFAVGLGFVTGQVWLDIAGLIGFVVSFSVGIGPICWLFASEILPYSIRAKGMMVAASINRLASAAVALTFLSLSNGMGGPGQVFFFYSAAAFATYLFAHAFVPETKGKSLEEMTTLFEQIARKRRDGGGGGLLMRLSAACCCCCYCCRLRSAAVRSPSPSVDERRRGGAGGEDDISNHSGDRREEREEGVGLQMSAVALED